MPQFFTDIHAYIMDADRIPCLVAAIFLTMVAGIITGPIAGNANSLFWGILNATFGRVGDRLDRVSRSKSDLILRGLLLCVGLLSVALLLGWGAQSINSAFMEITIVSLCLTSGSVWYMMLRLYFALDQKGKAKGAYYGLSRSSRIDLNSTDDFGITRAGLSFSAISFDKGLIAPSLWYLIGGLPVLLIYSSISFAAWRFGKCGFTKGFGLVPLYLDKIIGLAPSLFTGFIFCAASAITPTLKFSKAISSWWVRKGKAPYEQGGIVLSAIAWPLGVSLGGTVVDISGSTLENVWIGDDKATAKINHQHLKRAILMNVIAHIIFIMALLLVYIYAEKIRI